MKLIPKAISDQAAWHQYQAHLSKMDTELDRMETGTPEYDAAWHDRMGFAANRYPGAPAPEPGAEAEPEAGS